MTSFNINSLNDEEKFALFYGIMLGDGCLSYYKSKEGFDRFTIAITGNIEDKKFYEETIKPILLSWGRKSVTIKNRRDCNGIEINFPNKYIFDKIKNRGFPVGKKGPDITIPSYFYDNNLIGQIVAGFMATDGSLVLTKNPNKYYPRIEGTSISKKLIKQIHDFLISIGMNGSFYLAKRRNIDLRFNRQQQYRFQFNGKNNLLIFNEKIGFVNPKYENKFTDFLIYDKEYDSQIKGVPSQKQKKIRLTTLNG